MDGMDRKAHALRGGELTISSKPGSWKATKKEKLSIPKSEQGHHDQKLTRLQVEAPPTPRSSYSPQENRLFFTTAEKILCMSFRSAYCTSGPEGSDSHVKIRAKHEDHEQA